MEMKMKMKLMLKKMMKTMKEMNTGVESATGNTSGTALVRCDVCESWLHVKCTSLKGMSIKTIDTIKN